MAGRDYACCIMHGHATKVLKIVTVPSFVFWKLILFNNLNGQQNVCFAFAFSVNQ